MTVYLTPAERTSWDTHLYHRDDSDNLQFSTYFHQVMLSCLNSDVTQTHTIPSILYFTFFSLQHTVLSIHIWQKLIYCVIQEDMERT